MIARPRLLRPLSAMAMALAMVGCQAPDDGLQTLPVLGDRAPVDAAINDFVAGGGVPLLYVRVERFDGSVAYEHSAVNPQFTTRLPDGDSWFRIWSMSKSVTIPAILSLEEDGLLSRSDPVTDYIPEFEGLQVLSSTAEDADCDADLRAPKRAMTVEDLLNHNDGFYYMGTPYPCLNQALAAAALPEATSTDDLVARIAQLPLHPTGVGANNYGIGTTVLALVAERAAGKPFDEVVEERITGPLGIDSSLSYYLPDGAETYDRVVGTDGELRLAGDNDLMIFGGPVPEYGLDNNIFLGGEGMVSTTRGYAKFLRAMGSHGELDGVRILDEATVRDWYSPKTQLDNPYGHNGYNIWVTSGKFDGLPDQKPGLLVGGGYEGTAFWIDIEGGYVGLIMSQVQGPVLNGVDEVSRIRGLLYTHVLEPDTAE
ncbi:MAG: serine hydrolase [Parvularculaceae bacterium]|nr:serine hydrolase [Parvularculaceae bacterium]